MSAPSLGDVISNLPLIKQVIDDVLSAIEKVSPDVAKADEEAIRQAISDALSKVDLASLESSMQAVFEVLKAGKGISGGGADATLA